MPENTLFKTALSKSMALCSRREFCSYDIRNKLHSWNISSEDADRIITILTAENFINEPRYAVSFVKDKFNYNKWGKVKMASQLKAKGISSGNIKTAFREIDDETYMRMIKNLLTSHRRTIKAKNQYDLKAKLLRYGLSKGFESHILYDILGEDPEIH